MEELRSTEVLDREIQEDARRKAEKILKANEAECEQVLRDVAARIESARAEKEAEYRSRLDAYVRDSEAAIPLEKQRRLVTFVDVSVKAALDSWLEGIGPARRLALYGRILRKSLPAFGTSPVTVKYRGYGERDVRSVAESVFGPHGVSAVAESASPEFGDGIVAESADGDIACRATLSEVRETLLSGKRQELAEALMGGRIPEWQN